MNRKTDYFRLISWWNHVRPSGSFQYWKILSPPAPRTTASEETYNRWFCTRVNGEMATRHGYASAGSRGYVEVDCETGTLVYEGGLDKRSSLDSVQQALFFSHATGKRPAVVMYDTAGRVNSGFVCHSGKGLVECLDAADPASLTTGQVAKVPDPQHRELLMKPAGEKYIFTFQGPHLYTCPGNE